MMSTKKFDWVMMNWICQLLFFLVNCAALSINIAHDSIRVSGWIFMAAFTLVFAFSCINSLCLHLPRVREVIGITIILLMIFLVPLTFYALGGSIETTSGLSLLYVLVSITVSPLLIGISILACGLCYSAFIHYNNFFEQYPVFREGLSNIEQVTDGEKTITPTSKDKFKEFVVREPATVQQISSYDAVYGNKDYWLAILNANPDLPRSPWAVIPASTKLIIPIAKGRPYKIRPYKVPREATLKEISAQKDIYNNASYWRYLYEANRSKVIDSKLTVLGGVTLVIPELPKQRHYKFLIISLVYIAAALVGLCWRILLQELYRLLSVALSASTGQTIRDLEDAKVQLETLTKDNRRLRKEVAMHIVEIDQIINFKESQPRSD